MLSASAIYRSAQRQQKFFFFLEDVIFKFFVCVIMTYLKYAQKGNDFTVGVALRIEKSMLENKTLLIAYFKTISVSTNNIACEIMYFEFNPSKHYSESGFIFFPLWQVATAIRVLREPVREPTR